MIRQLEMFDNSNPVMPILDVSRCYTRIINHKTVQPILINDHYLHRECTIMLRVGMYVDNVLAGICCYGPTISAVSDAICGKEYRYNVLDLNRLFVYDWAGKNSESWLIGQSFKWLKQTFPDRFILVSYASPAHGHIGTVYKATNWLYTGISNTGHKFSINNKDLTARAVMAQYGTTSMPKLKSRFGNSITKDKTSAKHRYVYFLTSKFKRRKLVKKLRFPILPYPKRETNG